MLSQLQKDTRFNSIIDKFYKKYKKELLDIILFGSVVKGKEKPSDIDLLLLFKEEEDLDIAYELRKLIEKLGHKVQVTTKTYYRLFEKTFKARESFLSEGYSLIRKETISEGLAYSQKMVFKYGLKGFSQSKRMQFQYALYGRDKKSGIVKELALQKFADTVFLCPVENSERCKEFFDTWNMKFEIFPLLMPARIVR